MPGVPTDETDLQVAGALQPGFGPKEDAGKTDVVEFRGVAIAEQLSKTPRKALASFRYEGGSVYTLTGLLMAEAAVTLLDPKVEEKVRGKFGGGQFLTPASLGDVYAERVGKAEGVTLEVRQIGDVGSK
jgi:hypothetical protein